MAQEKHQHLVTTQDGVTFKTYDVKVGHAVKAVFTVPAMTHDGIQSERMWVEITRISDDGKQAVGTLKNHPTCNIGFRMGRRIRHTQPQ